MTTATTAARFSNGHVDPYKGRRAVKAAWMIVTPEGEIESGHSLDRATAEKTARNHASTAAGITRRFPGRGVLPAHYQALRHREAIKAGYRSDREFEAALSAKRSAFVAACTIEIVDL